MSIFFQASEDHQVSVSHVKEKPLAGQPVPPTSPISSLCFSFSLLSFEGHKDLDHSFTKCIHTHSAYRRHPVKVHHNSSANTGQCTTPKLQLIHCSVSYI